MMGCYYDPIELQLRNCKEENGSQSLKTPCKTSAVAPRSTRMHLQLVKEGVGWLMDTTSAFAPWLLQMCSSPCLLKFLSPSGGSADWVVYVYCSEDSVDNSREGFHLKLAHPKTLIKSHS